MRYGDKTSRNRNRSDTREDMSDLRGDRVAAKSARTTDRFGWQTKQLEGSTRSMWVHLTKE